MATVAELLVEINGNNRGLKRTLRDSQQASGNFLQSVTKIGAALGVAFGARELIRFGSEASKLAGQMEGVSQAFERLPASTKLLIDMQKATRGTVSELELMKRAVQANNFQIPLGQLATLFDFATKRAAQTGESVDYLVNSIITGIGRKSPLILDNLGISAVRLREELGGVGTEAASIGDIAAAVGKIATTEIGKMGDVTESTSQKTQRFQASLEGFQAFLGQKLNPIIGDTATILGSIIDDITGFGEKLRANQERIDQALGVFERLTTGAQQEEFERLSQSVANTESEIKRLQTAYNRANYSLEGFTRFMEENNLEASGARDVLNAMQRAVLSLGEELNFQKEVLGLYSKSLNEIGEQAEPQIGILKNLEAQLSALEGKRLEATTELEIRNLTQQIQDIQDRIDDLTTIKPLTVPINLDLAGSIGKDIDKVVQDAITSDVLRGAGIDIDATINADLDANFSNTQAEAFALVQQRIAENFTEIEQRALAFGSSFDTVSEKQATLRTEIENLLAQGFSPMSSEIQTLSNQLQNLGDKGLEAGQKIAIAMAEAGAQAIGQADSFLEASRIILGALAREIVALAVRNALTSPEALAAGPFAIAIGAAAGLAAQGLVNRLLGDANFTPNTGNGFTSGSAGLGSQGAANQSGSREIIITGLSGNKLRAIEKKHDKKIQFVG